MRYILFLALAVVSIQGLLIPQVNAAPTPPHMAVGPTLSPHKFFVISQSIPAYNLKGTQIASDEFDSWTINKGSVAYVDSGYAYEVFDSVDLYVGARIDSNGSAYNQSGLLSGVSYTFNDIVSLNSTLHTTSREAQQDGEEAKRIAAEVSSRVKLSKHLDLHATLDYEEWQQGVQVGLGFRF